MKKLLLLIIAAVSINIAFAQQQMLPQKANEFIKANFAQDSVMSFKQDSDDIDVYLSNGSKVSFLLNGEWKEVDGKGSIIPTQFVPSNIMKSIKTAYPQAQIIKVEKEYGKYEFKLNNNMELDIDVNGKILKQKLDD